MSDTVKRARGYDSSRRQEQARRNRREVLTVAKRLFLANGYAATTIGQIAKAAGVSVETVYKAFTNKSGVLKAVFDVTVAGDDEPIPMVERDDIKAVIAEPDPARKIRLYAKHMAEVQPRIAAVQLMVRDAAASDPGAADVWRQLRAELLNGMAQFAANLQATGGLRSRLPANHVRDLLWTFNSVEFFELLVLQRGWSPKRYAEFVADTLIGALLPAAADRGR
jgi:AcrR family transcriptional regulator